MAVRQLYGGQIEAVSLLAGLFLHFSNPALIFPPWPPYPHWLPGKFPLPPPHLSVWLGRGPLASQVIELWGRQPRLCRSTFGFLPCRDWGGWKGGKCGPRIPDMLHSFKTALSAVQASIACASFSLLEEWAGPKTKEGKCQSGWLWIHYEAFPEHCCG